MGFKDVGNFHNLCGISFPAEAGTGSLSRYASFQSAIFFSNSSQNVELGDRQYAPPLFYEKTLRNLEGPPPGMTVFVFQDIFKETIMKRAVCYKQYRKGLLAEAVNELLEVNLDVSKVMLCDYINATITFLTLAEKLNKSGKSIHRMMG